MHAQGFSVFMLFSGILLQPSHVTWVFRWLAYVSPLRWAMSIFVYYVLIDTVYTGAMWNATLGHFSCAADATGHECYGITGRQILTTLSHNYEVITPDLDFTTEYLYLLCIAVAFKVGYGFTLFYSFAATWQAPAQRRTSGSEAVTPTASVQPKPNDDVTFLSSANLPPQRNDELATRSARSELSTDAGAVLTFKDCAYVVKLRKRGPGGERTRLLLEGCSARVPAGEVLALMGPSGAGKTTLLNMLTLEKSGGTPSGSISLNGHPFTFAIYQRHACYVTQTSQLWPFLTVREHLSFAAALYQPSVRTADTDIVSFYIDKLLKETGLEDCQETRAGNEIFKGLSGGQKRRLSLAVALCKRPHVVFLDEPTSGLDAASAASIMYFVKETAARMHIPIICTIHQPSSSVFASFDSVCFLTGGRFAYMGKASALPAYLVSVERPLPPNSNPADFMLDLTNRDFSERSTVDHMLTEWSARAPEVEVDGVSDLLEPPVGSFCNELRFLSRKHLLLVTRDPMQYAARVVLFLSLTTFMAVLYIQARNLTQEQALDKLFFANWLVSLPGM